MINLIVSIAVFAAGYMVSLNIHQSIRQDSAVYGEDVDHSMPWNIQSCEWLAEAVEVGHIVRLSDGRRDLYMQYVIRRIGERKHSGEMVREISDAWDAGADGATWGANCLKDLRNFVRKERM